MGFSDTPEVKVVLAQLKFAIDADCQFAEDADNKEEDYFDDQFNNNEDAQKQSKLRGYKAAMHAVEQTLIALSRMKNLPDAKISVAEYMKNTMHLYARDYASFQQTKLKLQHLDVTWRYLEKLYVRTEGLWAQVPDTVMQIYMEFIEEQQRQSLKQ